jgi:hypothetical protein
MGEKPGHTGRSLRLCCAVLSAVLAAACAAAAVTAPPPDPPAPPGPPVAVYSLTYDANGGSGTVPIDTHGYPEGASAIVLSHGAALSKTGYLFAGWNTSTDGKGATYAPGSAFTMGNADATLFAQWVLPTWRVLYDANGGSGTPPADDGHYLPGATATALGNTTGMTLGGFSFAGWNTRPDGVGTTHAAGDSFTMAAADVTLYAVWVPQPLTFTSSGTSIRITGYTTAPTGSLVIPGGVTAIDDNALSGATALTAVSLPPTVTSIGATAFKGCARLAAIPLPAAVTSIGAAAFQDCTSLSAITIPAGVTVIANYLFSNCGALASVSLPAGITSIGLQSFAWCARLASLAIPTGVTSIASNAFQDCTLLDGITLPPGITTLRVSTFQGCTTLSSITVPAWVGSVENQVFLRCTHLATVTVIATTPPGIDAGSDPFAGCAALARIRVPTGSVGLYKGATGWSTYASKIVGF